MEAKQINPIKYMLYKILMAVFGILFFACWGLGAITVRYEDQAKRLFSPILRCLPVHTKEHPMLVIILGLFGTALLFLAIVAVFFKDENKFEQVKQFKNLKGRRVLYGIIFPAIIICFILVTEGRSGILTATCIATVCIFRHKWLMDIIVGQSEQLCNDFEKLGLELSGDPDPRIPVPFVGKGVYSGLKVYLTKDARFIHNDKPAQAFYILQVETNNTDIKMVIQAGEINAKGCNQTITNLDSEVLKGYSIATNDAAQAEQLIRSNAPVIREILAWSSGISLNVSLVTPANDGDKSFFGNTGILTAVRDRNAENGPITLPEALDKLIELSKRMSLKDSTIVK